MYITTFRDEIVTIMQEYDQRLQLEVPMTDRPESRQPRETTTITVHVEPSSSTRLPLESRREVLDSSFDSLWGGPSTVTLRRIDDTPE